MTWYSDWPYRKQITIDGHMISGNHTNFPFLFKLTGNTHISSNAHSGGKDFIFTTSDGSTRVNCERDGYLGGSGCFWVKAPTLSNYTTATFYLYYGTKTDNSQDISFKASGVWEPSYQAVFHMSDVGVDVLDSTYNGFTGTGSVALDYRSQGKINKSISFDSDLHQIISVLDPSTKFNFVDITVEVTMKTDYNKGAEAWNQRLVWYNGANFDWGLTLSQAASQPVYVAMTSSLANHSTAFFNNYELDDNNWHYIAGRTHPEAIFVDGTQDTYRTTDSWSFDAPSSRLLIGSRGSNFWFSGSIDEVRISNKIRSNGWIKTTYSSMNSPQTYITLGVTEEIEEEEPENWYDLDWTYRKKITIHKERVSGSNLVNFPILYKISGIGRNSLSTGKDIIFVDSGNENRLHHDLLTFSNYTGNVWVQIPILTDTTDTIFNMYYGADSDHTQDVGYKPSSTWDNTYSLVCHMHDTDNDYTLKDSTKWLTPLYKSGSTDVSLKMVKAFLGSGQEWINNGSGYISSNSINGLSTISSQASVSIIVSGGGMRSTNYAMAYSFHSRPTNNKIKGLGMRKDGKGTSLPNVSRYYVSTNKVYYAGGAISDYYWPSTNIKKTSTYTQTYISGADAYFYLYSEGTRIYTNTYSKAGNLSMGGGIFIGQRPDLNYHWSGCILEIQVSNKARSYGWARTFNTNTSSMSIGKNYLFCTNGLEETYSEEEPTTTYFYTQAGSPSGWTWKLATLNTDQAPYGTPLGWAWTTVTNASQVGVPSGNTTGWKWN